MDYEPIHHSEIKSFLSCRFRWWLTAPPPRGLFREPNNPRSALHIGRLTHEALQEYHDKGTDPDVAFLARALEQEDRMNAQGEGLWAAERGRIRIATEKMTGVLRGYRGWSVVNDSETEFLATEVKWGEPGDPPVMMNGIPFAGRFDAVIKRHDGVWVLDFKTTTSTSVGWTEQDLQATLYIWAARQMFENVRGLIFRFIRKKAPWDYENLILKSGSVTQRKNLADITTLQNYLTALAVAVLNEIRLDSLNASRWGLGDIKSYSDLEAMLRAHDRKQQPWWDLFASQYNAAKRLYFPQLQELKGGSEFIWETAVIRTDTQMKNYLDGVILPAAWRMMDPAPWTGPTGLGAAYALCGRCSFKSLCRTRMDGADWKALLEEDFRVRVKEEF